MPVYVTPGVDVYKDADGRFHSGLTVEETYKGVNSRKVKFSGAFYMALKDELKQKQENEGSIPENWADIENIGDVIKQVSSEQFLKMKYGSRSLTVQCE